MVSARMMGARKKVATARRRSMWVRRVVTASVNEGCMGGGWLGVEDGGEVVGGDGPGAGVEVCTDEGVCAVVGGWCCGDGEEVYGAG